MNVEQDSGAGHSAGMVLESEISAVVVRCGCGNPLVIHPGEPCPTPRRVEDIGIISYYHRNPVIRFFKGRYYKWLEGRKRKYYEEQE